MISFKSVIGITVPAAVLIVLALQVPDVREAAERASARAKAVIEEAAAGVDLMVESSASDTNGQTSAQATSEANSEDGLDISLPAFEVNADATAEAEWEADSTSSESTGLFGGATKFLARLWARWGS